MSVEVYNDYMVCSDCLMFIANGDGPEYLTLERNGEALYEERYAEIVSGVERLQALCPGGSLVTGDSDEDNEFSSRPCDCCEQPRAAGSRHKATLLCTKSAGVGYGGHGESSDKQRERRDYERGQEDARRELPYLAGENIREYLASTRSQGGAYQRGYNEVLRERLVENERIGDELERGGIRGLGASIMRGLGFWRG